MSGPENKVRIDKWLWAARFYKTRGLAADAVEGGKVQVNGERVKPAKALKPGDVLAIRNGPYGWVVTVRLLAERRGSATEAARLFEESPQSRATREETAARLKAQRQSNPFPGGRPTKRQRRQIHKFFEENE
ncbi:MAG TPA: S4 domain-containing protein [Burkholderiales bacterium]|jgi:ribosome-associated heat shock protein Hsp15|nr:S4 domain-containing protein [Burkholderiales bacterium]